MHELGLCEGVVHAIEQRAAKRRVARVGVRCGALLRVVPDAFTQSFELVATGTVADGAGVDLEIVPAQATCRDCGAQFSSYDPATACCACAGVAVDVHAGDELTLTWLEYRDEAASARPDG